MKMSDGYNILSRGPGWVYFIADIIDRFFADAKAIGMRKEDIESQIEFFIIDLHDAFEECFKELFNE